VFKKSDVLHSYAFMTGYSSLVRLFNCFNSCVLSCKHTYTRFHHSRVGDLCVVLAASLQVSGGISHTSCPLQNSIISADSGGNTQCVECVPGNMRHIFSLALFIKIYSNLRSQTGFPLLPPSLLSFLNPSYSQSF
jgi:hypothetical protein